MSEITGSQESHERARAYHVHQREKAANIHNKYNRNFLEKVLGKGKISEADVAKTEAASMNEKIDEISANGTAMDRSKAMEIMEKVENAQGRVFNPSPEFDGGESMRYAGNFQVSSNPASEEGGEEKDI